MYAFLDVSFQQPKVLWKYFLKYISHFPSKCPQASQTEEKEEQKEGD